MNKQSGRIGLYLVLFLMMIAGYMYLSNQVNGQSDYTLDALEQAVADDQVLSAEIYPNREVPTGAVVVDIQGVGRKKLYATDVTEVEKLLRDNGITTQVDDVPQENVFLTTLLPILLACGLTLFLVADVRRRRQCQDDELWQKPCEDDASG